MSPLYFSYIAPFLIVLLVSLGLLILWAMISSVEK